MRTNLPTYQSVYGSWGSILTNVFYYRAQPNPNQSGSPGTLPNLTGATFTASLLDMYDQPVSGVTNLATYLTGSTGGTVTLSIPQAVVESIPAGSYRYKIALAYSTFPLSPTWAGPFLVAGNADAVVISPPGSSEDTCVNPGIGLQFSQPTASNGTFTLLTWNPAPFYLNEMRLAQTVSGSCTVAVLHNGVAVDGWDAVAVTSTPQTVAPDDTQILVVTGDSLDVVITNNSSALGLEFTLSGIRYGC